MRPTNAQLGKAVRCLIAVIEAGPVNSAQLEAIQYVHVALGDIDRVPCPHSNTAYEEGDVLVCQDCRAVLEPSST